MSIKGISFYIFLSTILTILFVNEKNYLLLVALAIVIFIFIKKYGFKLSLFLLFIFAFFNFYKPNEISDIQTGYIQKEFYVDIIKEKYSIVSDENTKYLLYHDNQKLTVDDEIFIKGNCTRIENDLQIDVFEFASYLEKQRVFYQIDPIEIKILQSNKSVSGMIKEYLLSNLEGSSYVMCKMLLFNDKYADIENYNNLKDINAIHLFVVSGFHISFFFNLISKIFKSNKIGIIIGILVCFFYVFLLDFSISATRALISLVLSKCFNKYINQIDVVSIPGILLLLIEPLNVYNYSFILSFLMAFTICFSSSFLKKLNKIMQPIILSFICFIAMIPIQLVMNYKINFISLFTNIILSYVVMGIFILCLLSILLSVVNGNILSIIYLKFFEIIEKISNINSSIVFGSIKVEFVLLYYLLFVLFLFSLEKKKMKQSCSFLSMLFAFLLILYNRHYFMFYQQVTFLNVYQGDCTIIQDSYNGKVMLIDTGGLINYDIANKTIMPYLNYHGIRKIDVVVITHEDYDHCGALEELKKQIKIDKIITNQDNVENVNLGKIHLENINNYYTSDSSDNDKSIVLHGNICSLDFLFTGDISFEIENEIIKDYEYFDIDVLKVSHHGSKYSTSNEFVSHINPEIAIISVGKNYYGHPSEEVLQILKNHNVEIYRTDQNGTIKIKGKIFDNWFIDSAK